MISLRQILATVLNAMCLALSESRSKLVARIRAVRRDGTPPHRVLLMAFRCNRRKVVARSMTFDLEFVRLSEVVYGHPVCGSDKQRERTKAIRALGSAKKSLTFAKLTKLMPSDEPIKLIEEGNSLVVFSGHGRVDAMLRAGVTYAQVLVYRTNSRKREFSEERIYR